MRRAFKTARTSLNSSFQRARNPGWRKQLAGKKARWGIAATVREPVELLLPFVSHHLDIGATSVALYFDDPDDPAAEVLETIDGVDVIRCDARHWHALGRQRPSLIADRQRCNAQHAYEHSKLEWLIGIDADEYLQPDDNFASALSSFAASKAFWIQLQPWERIWEKAPDRSRLFGGSFRSPLPGGPQETNEIYGPGHDHLYPSGVAGHDSGKAMSPVGIQLRMGVHKSFLYHRRIPTLSIPAPGVKLLHFEGLTERHWILKNLRQALQVLEGFQPLRPQRRQVTLSILNAEDPVAKAREYFENTYILDADVLNRLASRGYLHRCPFDVSAAVKRFAPSHSLAFNHQEIDSRIEPALEQTLAEVLRLRALR